MTVSLKDLRNRARLRHYQGCANFIEMKRPNFYAGFGLERIAERRSDQTWLNGLLHAEGTVVLPLWRSMNFVITGEEPRAVMVRARDSRALIEASRQTVFLGCIGDVAHFAVDLSHFETPADAAVFDTPGEFVDLRSVGVHLTREEGGLLAYARGILHWHTRHQYCGVCGNETEGREAGHMRICTNPDCRTQHFPRTDPAVIMLVSQGDRVVLGRKDEWPDGMYSTLAGFVEPGESLEEAVAREVKEEVDIDIANVRYHSSQPWPFPASLMLGFYADALSDDITMNPDELEDARWFTRAELADGGAGIDRRPRSDSIARRMIEDWIKEG